MSDIIHLLPDSVANQIAAGEVVQRPASVIKELLENSIDAHATEVQIVLREAGRELIQVIDNGVGMSPTDARMAFERHATSKISQASDLFELHTMGFRGEALASIVAVAEVELRTRRAEDECGICLVLAGSKLQRQEPVSCPVGSNFQVRNLFFNVPARRKFLKANQTELSNIITEFQHVALAHPDVGFTLIHNDAIQVQLTAGSSVRQRITALFAKTIGQQLLPVSLDNELFAVSGFVGQPESARKKGAQQYFFVNNRFMKHPYFHKAVMECYGDILAEGEQPNYFLYLTVDPATIDVNIHPTKTEIKFENESARWRILVAAVREALGKFNAVPSIDFDMADAPEIPAMGDVGIASESGIAPQAPRPQFSPVYDPFKRDKNTPHWESLYNEFSVSREHPQQYASSRLSPIPSALSDSPSGNAPLPSKLFADAENLTEAATSSLSVASQETSLVDAAGGRRFFQLGGRYILTTVKSGLMLIDQHRAHINVLFDSYHEQIQRKQGVSQSELFPELIEFAPADLPILDSILTELGYLGFELDNLGGGSFAINGRPASMGSTDVKSVLYAMIEVAKSHEGSVREEIDRQLALKLAQAGAIPYGRTLSGEEMEQLSDSLFALAMPNYTPDGKPVLSLLSYEELAKRFSL